jgi:predicted HTH transcriptional regulator
MTPSGRKVRLFPKSDLRPTLMQAIVEHWSELHSATAPEIADRWRLDASTCDLVLAELVERGIIRRVDDGAYELVSGNPSPGGKRQSSSR